MLTDRILRGSLLILATAFCVSQVSHLPMFDQTCYAFDVVQVVASAITRIAGVVFLATGLYYLIATETISGFLKLIGICVVVVAFATYGWVLVNKIDISQRVSETLDDPGRSLEILDAVNTNKTRPAEELSDISHTTAAMLYVQHGMISDVLTPDRLIEKFVPTAEDQARRQEWKFHRDLRDMTLLWYYCELIFSVGLIALMSIVAIRRRRSQYPAP